MECPKCSNEQLSGSFCSKCGEQLVAKTEVQSEDKQEEVKQPSQTPQQKEDRENSTNKKSAKMSLFEKRMFTAEEVKMAAYFTVGSLAMVMAIAWAITFLLKSSAFIKDYTYMLLSSITEISDQILLQIVTQLKVTLWDVLLVAHGGSSQGEIMIKGMDPIRFEWKLPVIIAIIFLMFIFIMIGKLLNKRFSLTMKQRVNITMISALSYAIVITVMMLLMNPSYGIAHQYMYKISTSPFEIFFHAFIMVIIASFIGFELWKAEFIQRSTLIRPILALRPFFITLFLSLIVMGVVIIVMWSLIHPSSVFSKPLTTPASLWMIYQSDPLFYILLPTFLVGELLYSVGANFVITSAEVGGLLQIPYEISFHSLTGIHIIDGQIIDENHLGMIEKSTQLIWYSFAFLLVFLYSLNRVKLTGIRSLISQMIFIGIIFACLAMAVSVTFTSSSENVAGMIGFPVLMSGVAAIVVSAIYFTLKYFFKKKIIDTKEGEQHE